MNEGLIVGHVQGPVLTLGDDVRGREAERQGSEALGKSARASHKGKVSRSGKGVLSQAL